MEKVQNLGPSNVLKRGFSLARKLNGEVVRQMSQCKTGEILEVLLAEGSLTVKVESSQASWKVEDKQKEQSDIYRNIIYKDSV
jgi:exonuclease VII large subunit